MYQVNDITNKIEKTMYWMDESKKHADRGDNHYSGICFEKAYLLAEELLELCNSRKTFLTSSEKEYLKTVIGISDE